MALETASYIAQLNVANPLSTDAVSQADDHLRLIKSVLKNTFPNLDAPVTATPGTLNTPIAAGIIAMWSGAVGAVPAGWALCDGTNGTPNLKNRFIVGAGDAYAVGATGGADSVTLSESQIPGHTHVISATTASAGAHSHSVSDPGHSHSTIQPVAGSTSASSGGFYGQGGSASTSTATTGISLGTAAAHTHNVSASAATTGGGLSHENRPPYYALAYIMKV
jgi:microcystin-dependent protein